MTNKFQELRAIDVTPYVEKKQNLDYLSWAWAVDFLLQQDPTATWEYRFGTDIVSVDGNALKVEVPYVRIGQTAMVFCTVHAFGISRTAQLAVVNHANRPIANPDSFQLNTAMQRSLVKAIALHGIGLSVYRGEDVKAVASEEPSVNQHKPKGSITATTGVRDALDDRLRAHVDKLAMQIQAQFDAGKEYAAFEMWDLRDEKTFDKDASTAVWSQLSSKCRSYLKEQAALAANPVAA